MTRGTILQYFTKTPSSSATQGFSQTRLLSTEALVPAPEPSTGQNDTLTSNDTHAESDAFPVTANAEATDPVPEDPPTPTPIPHLPHTTITPVTATHLEPLKRLTSSILPVRYPDKFYTAILLEPSAADFTRTVLHHGKPIGWIRCRLEPSTTSSSDSQTAQVYIQALCVLAPYREQGLATCLLREVLQPGLLRRYKVGSIYAHVWESNEEALEWYRKRGFREVLMVGQYYKRLKPAGAWIMRKDLGVLDHLPTNG
jgi:N-alpha-acetyltransferase 50